MVLDSTFISQGVTVKPCDVRVLSSFIVVLRSRRTLAALQQQSSTITPAIICDGWQQMSNMAALFSLWRTFEERPHATVRDHGRGAGREPNGLMSRRWARRMRVRD